MKILYELRFTDINLLIIEDTDTGKACTFDLNVSKEEMDEIIQKFENGDLSDTDFKDWYSAERLKKLPSLVLLASISTGICSKCRKKTVLKPLTDKYWLCKCCYEEEQAAARKEYEEGVKAYEQYMFKHPELYFCDDARNFFYGIGFWDED